MNPEYKNAYFTSESDVLPASFAIVTAYNPDGVTAEATQNDIADQALYNEATQSGWSCCRMTGMSQGRSHQEPGWGIECSESEGIELGRKYQQEAIFWIHDDRIMLINVTTRDKIDLGSFSALILS